MYKVYCHTFPNRKRYIGITRTSLKRRWGNGANYSTCPLVNRAIMKYGWENVQHEILCEVDTLEEAEIQEQYYISLYSTQNPDKGYNILPGGDVSDNSATEEMRYKLGNGWRGKKRSEEEKEKISQGVKEVFRSRPESNGHYGLHHSDEARLKMSETHKKRWASDEKRREQASERMRKRMADPTIRKAILDNLAKCPKRKKGEWSMPDETKEKIRQANKGKWIGAKSPCSKPVLQFTKDGQFVKRWANAGEAERAGIAQRTNISKCCRNAPHVKTVAGFVWKYEQ